MESNDNTFERIAEEWLAKIEKEGRANATLKKARWLLRDLTFPNIGARPIDEISAADVLAVLKRIEKRGHHETARRLRSVVSRVFRYAVASARASVDPTAALRGALIAPKVTHRPAVTNPNDVGTLLRAIDGYQGYASTVTALKLAPHVFVRPGELRTAEWSEFDLKAGIWRIPATKDQNPCASIASRCTAVADHPPRIAGADW